MVAYCRQAVDRRDDDVDALPARDDGLAAELRGRLALDPGALRAAQANLDTARRTQAAASRAVSAGRRMKDKNDSDARGILASSKASWAAAKAGRVTASARTQLERAEGAVPVVERDTTLGGRIFASYQRAPSPVLFRVSAAALECGEHVVLRDVRVTIGREDAAASNPTTRVVTHFSRSLSRRHTRVL